MTISPPEREQKKEPVLDKPIETDAIPVDFSKLDKPGFWSKSLAKRLRISFEELGPAFIKMGQIISTREI